MHWLRIISLLTPLPEVFYKKIYKSLKPDPFDTHHILLFIPILNLLLCNILSEAVLLGKPSKSL